jgi:hypothetical protein
MQTSKGVVQGYVGVATVDKKHQVIVNAEVFGQGSEKDLLIPSLESTRDNFAALEGKKNILAEIKILARISHQPRLPWMRGAKQGAIVVYAPCFGNVAGTVRSAGLR